jgi:hypothetical protein
MSPSGKPLPVPTPESQPYWDGAKEHRLRVQRCSACAHHQLYPRRLCTRCGAPDPAWVDACGRGAVESFTVVRRAIHGAYALEVPYVVALIRLEEGPRLMSNIVECVPEAVRMGAEVDVVFEARSPAITVPQFRLRPGA